MKNKIKSHIEMNKSRYFYAILFIVLVFLVSLISYLDAYITYIDLDDLGMDEYWRISFYKTFTETVLVSIFLVIIIDVVKKIAKEDEEKDLQKIKIWTEVISEPLENMKSFSDEVEKYGLEFSSRKHYRISNELLEMSKEYEKISPLRSEKNIKRRIKKIEKRLAEISDDLFPGK